MEQHASPSPMRLDETEQDRHRMPEGLLWLASVQAVRPTRHWWHRPRGLAWFQVLMIGSLVKRPASAGLLSRRGDDLLQHEGLGCCSGSGGVRPFLSIASLLEAPL